MTNKHVLLDKTEGDDQPGACYIPDPQTGQQKCHYITKTACDQRGGTFYGGLCPPIDAVASVKVMPGVAKADETTTDKKIKKTKNAKNAKNAKKTKTTKKSESAKKQSPAKRKKKTS
jgi:hypothetical protein